jgi:hypothetical protein
MDSSLTRDQISLIHSTYQRALDNIDIFQWYSYSSYNPPIIHRIHHVLHTLHDSNNSYKYLDTNFSSTLLQKGWTYAYQKFFLHENSSRYAKSTKVLNRPSVPTLY